jgi:hypothetical protein
MKHKPYSSPLEPHIDLVRSMRRGRKTWPEIARRLELEHGLKTSHKTVQNWFKRWSDRVSKGKPLPMGFEPVTEKKNKLLEKITRKTPRA